MKKKYIFEVYETGYERHTGDFYDIHLRTDKLQDALEKYSEILGYVKRDEGFFMRKYLHTAEESTHTPSAFNYSIDLPVFSIPPDGCECYELSISCVEIEISEESKKFAILINRTDTLDSDDELHTWVDFHKQLLSSNEEATKKLNELIQEEFEGLCSDRGNDTDYHLDKEENTIYDSETGCNIPVAHYYIVEFDA